MKALRKHYVIMLGASAGGLEAIQEFFDHMPQTGNLSFVVIQHLSSDYKSLLVELLARRTNMKVLEAAHNMPVLKNCIYVIPNNKQIRIEKNRLLLQDKTHDKVPNNAIDVFLHSLAADKKNRAIAVILSGTGSDGTRGISSIKENGGLVMVQDPSTAKFDGMPQSAIHSGHADVIDSPAGIAEAILKEVYTEDNSTGLQEPDEHMLSRIFELIYKNAGQDFHYYKTPTIFRRLNKKMIQQGFSDPAAYVQYLEQHPEECKELAKDFLISVTRFFRDNEAYKVLQQKALPQLLEERENSDPLKIWVTACSTGEEAYSIAITVEEALQQAGKQIEVKIFASDIDASNLDIASAGFYPAYIENDVPRHLLDKYFIRKSKGYQIVPHIRKQIVFARHDITKDPPFIKNDLVCCRNMLIYMNSILQERVYAILQFALNKHGILLLGSSENPPFTKNGTMQQVSMKWKIFRKLADSPHRLLFRDQLQNAPKIPHPEASGLYTSKNAVTKGQKDLWQDTATLLTEDMGLMAFYIDRNFEIHESIGNYEQLLTLPKRILNLNLARMLPQELSLALNREIRKAWKTGQTVQLNNIVFGKEQESRCVNLLIKPTVLSGGKEYSLVLFMHAPLPAENVVRPVAENVDLDYLHNMELELAETKNSLQMAIEDLETANEELQSSNEELLSANEELQSSNEELQSLNEELYTLNTEHQLKIKELVELNDDLNNYFRSTDIAQVFLDAQLNIRKFNPAATQVINFIETDLGRPISHLSGNFKYDRLLDDILYVQRTRQVVEKEIALNEQRNFLLRILPYITRENKYEGIIIAFIDITVITNLNNIIRSVFNATTSAIFALRTLSDSPGSISDFMIDAANTRANDLFGHAGKPLTGQTLKTAVLALATPELLSEYRSVVLEDTQLHRDIFLEQREAWFEITAVKMPGGLLVTFTDITDKKKAIQKIRKSYSELTEVKENLKKLNAELEDKVKERTRELSLSEERFRLVAQATNDTLWDWDMTSNTVWWSDSFSELLGYAPGSLTRQDWLQLVHPAEREQVAASIHKAIHENERQWSREYRICRPDGEEAYILDRGYILHNEFNVPYRMLGSMLDITPLRKTQQELAVNIAEKAFLAESMPLVIWTTDETGNVDFVNRQFLHYTGLQYEEALGQQWQQAIHTQDLPGLLEAWKKAMGNRADFDCEVRIRTATTGFRWNLLRAKARLNEQSRLVSWLITSMDIHEQKQMNETLEAEVRKRTLQLQKSNEELESSNYDLQLFASVASHDLQEPLRKIHIFSQLIKDKYGQNLPADALVYLHKIMQASVRMRTLVNNILHFSKLSSDSSGFEKTDITELVKEVKDDLEMIIQEKKAEISIGNIPQMEVIRPHMQQVFQNLIGNALKFSSTDRPPRISISAMLVPDKSFDTAAAGNGNWCRIEIKDNGIGFDKQFRTRIFDLFQRLNSKDQYEGTGIGLAIVKKIVEKHNGIIRADSADNTGAVFTMVLPLEQANSSNSHGSLQENFTG
jgi:two-component system CheB/CheR fusion protein